MVGGIKSSYSRMLNALKDAYDEQCRVTFTFRVGNLHHAAQLECGQGLLREVHVEFLDGSTLLDPGGRTVVHRDRDRPRAGTGMDGLCQGAEDVVLLQCLDQLSLKLIRDGITTVLVYTNGKGIPHLHGVVALISFFPAMADPPQGMKKAPRRMLYESGLLLIKLESCLLSNPGYYLSLNAFSRIISAQTAGSDAS